MSLDPMPDSATLLALKAERERRLGVGAPTGALTDIIDRAARSIECSEGDDARLEKEHVRAADKQLRALGFRIINTSQPRHAKYITPGVPDRFYFHRARGLGFAWEAKTATGEQSAAQKDFEDDMTACGWPYVLGTDAQLFSWMLQRYPLVLDEQGHLIWRGE